MTTVKQRWWLRAGIWFGLMLMLQGITGLLGSWPRPWPMFMLVFGLLTVGYGWQQGVVMDDDGIRVRRLARRRKAGWGEIERFADDHGAVAVLTDGTSLRLFDWLGDTERAVSQLERQRIRQQSTA